jgi:predicted nucleic-acid-binding protein
MIGLDTSILVHFIVQEVPVHTPVADGRNREAGCTATYTFDKRAAKLPWHSLPG